MELFHVGKFGIFGSKDPTLFDGLGPCFGLVQITGSILLRYVLNMPKDRNILTSNDSKWLADDRISKRYLSKRWNVGLIQ